MTKSRENIRPSVDSEAGLGKDGMEYMMQDADSEDKTTRGWLLVMQLY